MCCLVIGAPCSDSVANMAASEFDLRIITHSGDVKAQQRLNRRRSIQRGEGEVEKE